VHIVPLYGAWAFDVIAADRTRAPGGEEKVCKCRAIIKTD